MNETKLETTEYQETKKVMWSGEEITLYLLRVNGEVIVRDGEPVYVTILEE